MRRAPRLVLVAFTVCALLGAAVVTRLAGAPAPHVVRADDTEQVLRGRTMYSQHCAACHGRKLQGQPLWQLVDKDSARRAPAHDRSGHTWMHPDEDLFHMTKFGRFPASRPDRVTSMPAFGDRLSDNDILAVLAFIEASWPVGLRAVHAALNPGGTGMPREAVAADWRFSAWCLSREPSAR